MATPPGNKHILLSQTSTSEVNNGDWDNTRLTLRYNGSTFDIQAAISGATSITYSDFVTEIQSNRLVTGSYYLINDYTAVVYMPYTDIVGDGSGGSESVWNNPTIEPLLVLATSKSTLSPTAWSNLYPQDIIIYDWGYGTTYPDRERDTVLGQSKGAILYREDTYLDVSFDYDWRGIKFPRWNNGSGVYNVLRKIDAINPNDYLTFYSWPWDIATDRTLYNTTKVSSPLQGAAIYSYVFNLAIPYELANVVIKPDVWFSGNIITWYGETIENQGTGNRVMFGNQASFILNEFNRNLIGTNHSVAGNIGTFVLNIFDGECTNNQIIFAKNNEITGDFKGNKGNGVIKNNQAHDIVQNTSFSSIDSNVALGCEIGRNIANEITNNVVSNPTGRISDNILRKLDSNTTVLGIYNNDADTIYNNTIYSIYNNSVNEIYSNTTTLLTQICENTGESINSNDLKFNCQNNTFSRIYANTIESIIGNTCSLIHGNSGSYDIIENQVDIIATNQCDVIQNIGYEISNNTTSDNTAISNNNVNKITGNVVVNTLGYNTGYRINANDSVQIINNNVNEIYSNDTSSSINNNVGINISGNSVGSIISYNNVKSIANNTNSGGINENVGITINANAGTCSINGNNVNSIIQNSCNTAISYNTGHAISENGSSVNTISYNHITTIYQNIDFTDISYNHGEVISQITGAGGSNILRHCHCVSLTGPFNITGDIQVHTFLHPSSIAITASATMSNTSIPSISVFNANDSLAYEVQVASSGTGQALQTITAI